MKFTGVFTIEVDDKNEVFFDMDEIDVVSKVLNQIINHGAYPHSSGPDFSIVIRPLSETIEC